jgi:hypothetical protein
MHPIHYKLDSRNLTARLGFWSSVLVTILIVWFYIAYALYLPLQQAPWHGLGDYAAMFRPIPLLAWVVPAFLLAPAFLVMICCLHLWIEEEKRIWSFLAVSFAVVYTTLMSVNYYIQMTVVQYNLLNGKPDGLSLWLYADRYPRSIPGAFEGVAYVFMCASLLLSSLTFGQGKLQRWARWAFVGSGITGLVVFIDPLFRLPSGFLFVDAIASAVSMTLAPILLSLLFRRDICLFRKTDNQSGSYTGGPNPARCPPTL